MAYIHYFFLLEVENMEYEDPKLLFLSHMSHELRTPLNVIIGMCEIAKYHIDERERVLDCLEKISVAGEHLTDIVDSVLDMTRIQQGKESLKTVNFCIDDFVKELRKLEMQGVSGLIIDLRNNGGGIVSSGTHIADLLLPEGTIIYTETKAGERTYYNSEPSATSLPYVLLVNEGTASTSEILSVAVKENEGGKLVGTNTFGKGIVQISVPLTDGSATTVTIEQYYSPDGNEIHGIGVQPDYVVELPADAETDLQLEKAIELLK